MRNITIHKTLYTFDELAEEAKQQAIETKRQEIAENYNYYEFYFTDTIGNTIEKWKNTGIEVNISDVLYSVSYSQGDGVSFITDTPINIDKALAFFTKEYPNYAKTVEEIKNNKHYQDIKLDYEFTIKRNDYCYTHENTVHCDFTDTTWEYTEGVWQVADKIRQIIDKLKDDICGNIYHELMEVDQYIRSDENIIELLELDGAEFTEDGIEWCH